MAILKTKDYILYLPYKPSKRQRKRARRFKTRFLAQLEYYAQHEANATTIKDKCHYAKLVKFYAELIVQQDLIIYSPE